jgi:hypothetical protein
MDLVKEAWDIAEYHFRIYKCRSDVTGEDDKFFKYNGSPVRQTSTRYDKLENEIDVDNKLVR